MARSPAPPQVPYLRIADDLRDRIASGELQPGDRVPSTRALAKTWGVALATATRALGTLTQAGVLRAEPRVGTVVAAPSSTARAPRSQRPPPARDDGRELSAAQVVSVAIHIADAEGLSTLSMRGVAAQLGVAPMSLYRHVPSKEDLLHRMIDAAFAEEPSPALRPAGWRARVELSARRQWALYRRHPWLSQAVTLSRPLFLPAVMKHADWALHAIEGLGLDADSTFRIHLTLYGYVQGLAWNLETERKAEAESGLTDDDWMDSQSAAFAAVTGSGTYPAFARIVGALTPGVEHELDDIFEFGLARLLDGFEALAAARPQVRRPKARRP